MSVISTPSPSAVTLALSLILPILLSAGAISNDNVPRHNSHLLTNVSIVDLDSGVANQPVNILIVDGIITRVGKSEVSDAFSSRLDTIDCTGMFALPGLFDCHTHVAHATVEGEDSLRVTLKRFVENGVMYVRDVGGPLNILSELAGRTGSGELTGPEFFFTGPMLEQSPLTWQEKNHDLPGFTVAIDTREAVDSILGEIAAAGGCCVKTFNTIEPSMYRYLKQVADSIGLRIVHDPGTPLFHWVPMDTALALGVTSFEHSKAPWPVILTDDLRRQHDSLLLARADDKARFPFQSRVAPMGVRSISMDRLLALADSMLEHGALLCPTLSVFSDLDADALEIARDIYEGEGEPPPMMVGMIKHSMAACDTVGQTCVREFAKRGVPLLVGQDGIDPDATVSEMMLMVEAGVSPLEVLRGATIYPARWLGVEDRIGSIEVGKQADLLITKDNPVSAIETLTSPAWVVHRGSVIGSDNR
ncbi:amidohydrolase family protein [bacterium]|nr:amidohydrolase family protein [bacterium]MCB2201954.1 amidohydrolase family protein [bacterium]